MKQSNKQFETIFFSLTLVVEIISILACFILYRKQKKLRDLSRIHQLDSQSSCGLIILRISIPITLGIIVLTGIGLGKRSVLSHTTIRIDDQQKQKEWNDIFKITIIVLVMEVCYIAFFVYWLYHLPASFERELKFDGVITEMHAMKKLEDKKLRLADGKKRYEAALEKDKKNFEKAQMKFAYKKSPNVHFIRNYKLADDDDISGHTYSAKNSSDLNEDPYSQYLSYVKD